jgi:serine/threonine protein kinase
MLPERWNELKDKLHEALELEPARRAVYLAQMGATDPKLQAELESLIAFHERTGTDFLNAPLAQVTSALAPPVEPDPLLGRRVGSYQIMGQIGVGGMGEVYRAFRADDEYKQQVAIKLVRAGQNSDFVLNRFKNERQILASLDHPNIARLLDGGTTDNGVPYFVMELIEGHPIDEYCDTHKLPTTERLKLFLLVCSAVQFAHQHLFIHRDVKPGNVLVTSDGVPKLLDFGIAKILEGSAVAAPFEPTLTALRVLTPGYASPEQIRGEPVSTASDVYSLGVVLYELLCGHSPYRVASRAPHELSRAVCEFEPEKPSVAVRQTENGVMRDDAQHITPATVSAVRDGSPERLRRRLSGDLDNILLMALRKEPQRRYASVEQFAEDIRRHLENLPVIARTDTVGYRASKFIIRHKAGVTVTLVVATALLLALAVTVREARIAERRFNDVRKLANSLIFEVHDSIRELPAATVARKLILERAQEYLDDLAKESKTDPGLLRELAASYSRLAGLQGDSRDANLGNTAMSLQNLRRAIELDRAAVALDPRNRDLKRELAEDYTRLDLPLFQTGDRKGERECLREALLILEPLGVSNSDDVRVQSALGKAYELNGSLLFRDHNQDGALESYGKSLHISEELAKVDPKNDQDQIQISFGHKHLGTVLAGQDHLSEALDHYRQALAIDKAQLAAHPDNLSARYYITYSYFETGNILAKRGDLDAALSNYQKALEIRAAMVAADPRDTRARDGLGTTYNSIGQLLQRKDKYSGALESFKKALGIREALAQADPANEPFHFRIAGTQSQMGKLYAAMAVKTSVLKEKQVAYCRESRRWIEYSMPVYQQLQAEGKLQGPDLENLAGMKRAREQCDRILAVERR